MKAIKNNDKCGQNSEGRAPRNLADSRISSAGHDSYSLKKSGITMKP